LGTLPRRVLKEAKVGKAEKGDVFHKSHRDEMFGKEGSQYLWCLHCERTYDRGKWRVVNGLQMCPYADCDGDAVLDAWDWVSVRDGHPEFPEVPVPGTTYSLC
jgi:hypothetical protein